MFESAFFWMAAFFTLAGAVLTAFSKNLMHACIYLLLCLIGVAGLFVTLSADLLAAIQLVVYVGGVVILMLFAVMLTGGSSMQEVKNKFGLESVPQMGNNRTFLFAGITIMVFAVVVGKIVLNSFKKYSMAVESTNVEVKNNVLEIGQKLITDHVLVFELSSVLLLGALVGAAIISRPDRNTQNAKSDILEQ